MNTREQFEAAWRKEYPLHSSTAFTRSGFDPERYANTRVQDGWLMWQAARATPADQAPIGKNWQERAQLRMLSMPENPNAPDVIGPVYNPVEVELRATPADHSSYALQMLVAAGHIPQAKVDEALAIAAKIPGVGEAQSVRDAWISVDERLPEQHEWVLVSDGTWSAIGTHLDDEDLEPSKRWMDESAELIESNGIKITHWMPMPAPPQKPNEVKP